LEELGDWIVPATPASDILALALAPQSLLLLLFPLSLKIISQTMPAAFRSAFNGKWCKSMNGRLLHSITPHFGLSTIRHVVDHKSTPTAIVEYAAICKNNFSLSGWMSVISVFDAQQRLTFGWMMTIRPMAGTDSSESFCSSNIWIVSSPRGSSWKCSPCRRGYYFLPQSADAPYACRRRSRGVVLAHRCPR